MSPARNPYWLPTVVGGIVAAFGLAIAVVLIALSLPSGPFITVHNDRSQTVTLACDATYRILPGHSARFRVDDSNDGIACLPTGPGFASNEQICFTIEDIHDGERIEASSLPDMTCG
jgi:hypothetical protein